MMTGPGGKRTFSRYHYFMDSGGDTNETDYRLAVGYRNAAWTFWLIPPIIMPILLLPLLRPSSLPAMVAEFWHLYLLFLGLPWTLGTAFWLHSRRLKRKRP